MYNFNLWKLKEKFLINAKVIINRRILWEKDRKEITQKQGLYMRTPEEHLKKKPTQSEIPEKFKQKPLNKQIPP